MDNTAPPPAPLRPLGFALQESGESGPTAQGLPDRTGDPATAPHRPSGKEPGRQGWFGLPRQLPGPERRRQKVR